MLFTAMEMVSLFNPFATQTFLALFFIFFIAKWFYYRAKKTDSNSPSLPSPPKLPILGNLHQLGSLPHRNLQSLARKYGPLMLLHFGNAPVLVVSSAEGAREIMRTHDVTFADRPSNSVGRRLLYDNKEVSTAPYGEYWRQLKSICVLQLLSNKRVQSYGKIREEETALLLEKIRTSSSSSTVNLSELFSGFASDVVCRSALGRKYENSNEYLLLLSELFELMGSYNIGDFIPWLAWINRFNGFDERIDRVARGLDEFLEGVIMERTEIMNKSRRGDLSHDGKEETFVDILLEIYNNNDSTGVPIERDSIKGIILDVFAAGTDTSSIVLEWAMTELIRHPIAMKKLQEEVRQATKDKPNDDVIISEKDLERMHYLKAVIKETLRYHTPVPLLAPRFSRKDANVMGYDIKAGTLVLTNAWAISRDPKYWEEPEKFLPERFLDMSKDYKGLDFDFIPFGSGRRVCPGISFAVVIIELALANIVRRFDWELPYGVDDLDVKEGPGLTVHRAVPLLAVAKEFQG